MTAVVELLGSSVGEAAARSLVHFLWQGALLGLIAGAALRALQKSSPQTRYATACALLLIMALSPVATFLFLRLQAPSGPITGSFHAARPQIVIGSLSEVRSASWFPVVLALWLAGVVVCSLRAAGGWALAIYRLSVQRKEADLAVRAAARSIAARLGIRRAVRVYESSMAAVPAVFGAIRPVIVLPVSAATGLPPAHIEAILSHELAHVARHDFLVNCVQSILEVVLFYHPAVWWLSRRIRQEREMCCDAMAAELCGDRIMYSRALLALEEGRQEFALAATGGDLKSRVEHLLRHGAQQHRMPELTTFVPALLIVAALLMCAATVIVRAQDKKSDTPYGRWSNQDVVYLMEEDERRAWERLVDDAEREQFIVQFWQRRDPTPGTPENEMKTEHYRRIAYVNARFGDSRPGWTTARGRVYILNGPPDEIESHPRDYREAWFYREGQQFEFTGQSYELTTQSAAANLAGRSARSVAVMERIIVERLPEPQRTHLRVRLGPFVGLPMSNSLMDQIRVAAMEIDRTLTYTWRLDPVTRNASLELSHDKFPLSAPNNR